MVKKIKSRGSAPSHRRVQAKRPVRKAARRPEGKRVAQIAKAAPNASHKKSGKGAASGGRMKPNANIFTENEVRDVLDIVSANESAVGYMKKNVSKRALEVLGHLTVPRTDEDLAASLDMKINAVRRILNMLQGYGVTNYYVSKNVNGWLSFAWYINVGKLKTFVEYIEGLDNQVPVVNAACNDYFICNSCYEKTKLIFTFDAAFEESFKCGACDSGLAMINKEEATKLAESAAIAQRQEGVRTQLLGVVPEKI